MIYIKHFKPHALDSSGKLGEETIDMGQIFNLVSQWSLSVTVLDILEYLQLLSQGVLK